MRGNFCASLVYLEDSHKIFIIIFSFSRNLNEMKQKKNLPNPVVIVADDGGIIKAGFIDPLSREGGPVELLTEDCGMSSVDDVCERFDGPRLP